ncbi:MAG: hypothetical protein V7K77_03100 [Nostoc sp.]|uniref:hypothetical protein n=1 Tax=Nostoc sp. TaxID=1180 RepID=UPI002FF4C4BF
MKFNGTYTFGLTLVSSLIALSVYGQSSPSSSPVDVVPSPQNTNVTSPTNSKKPLIRDSKGNVVGQLITDREGKVIGSVVQVKNVNVVKDANGNELYVDVKGQGIINGLSSTELVNWDISVALFLTLLGGAFGGLIFELINLKGNIEWPHKPTEDEVATKLAYATPKNVCDWGVFSRILIGVAAAPGAMLFFHPETTFSLIAMSIVAGSIGSSVFESLQNRLLIGIAQKEIDDAKQKVDAKELEDYAEPSLDKLRKAKGAFETLRNKIRNYAEITNNNYSVKNDTILVDFQEFENVREPLNQLQAIKIMKAPVKDILDAFKELKDQLLKSSISESGKETIKINSLNIKSESFDKVDKLLNEAIGLVEKNIVKKNPSTQDSEDKGKGNT